MGAYLTVPRREKESENGENTKVSINTYNRVCKPDLVEIWSNRNARMEKYHGGFPHCTP